MNERTENRDLTFAVIFSLTLGLQVQPDSSRGVREHSFVEVLLVTLFQILRYLGNGGYLSVPSHRTVNVYIHGTELCLMTFFYFNYKQPKFSDKMS